MGKKKAAEVKTIDNQGKAGTGTSRSTSLEPVPVFPEKSQPRAAMPHAQKPSAVVDTRIIYCGDNLEQLKKLPEGCVDLIYIDPPFNSNRNYEVFWGETKEKRAFDDRHASTQAYIEFMRSMWK